jgi:hypothetical protein
MATPLNNARTRERGLSIIEALVIVTVTALLALLLLPLASRAAGRNFALAEGSLAAADAANAEIQFRTLLHGAAQQARGAPSLHGQSDSVTVFPALAAATACARAGATAWVRLRIVQRGSGGWLACESEGRRTEVLAWSAGEARFSYSDDGAAWTSRWSPPPRPMRDTASLARAAPLVRFEFVGADRRGFTWAERAGWTEGQLQDLDGEAQ